MFKWVFEVKSLVFGNYTEEQLARIAKSDPKMKQKPTVK